MTLMVVNAPVVVPVPPFAIEIGIDELKANCMASGGAKTRKSLKRRTRKIQRWPKKF